MSSAVGRRAARAVASVIACGAVLGCSSPPGRQSTEPAPSTSARPSGSASAQASASPSAPWARLELPMRLGTRSQFFYRPLLFAAGENTDQLARLVRQPRDSAAQVYNGETDADYAVMVSAVAGSVRDEDATLDGLFKLLPRLRDIRTVEPGPLGGEARCGAGRNGDYHVTMCAWADRASVGTVTFLSPKKRPNTRGKEFVEIRSLLEIPGSGPDPRPVRRS
ncbi:hypothetical protein ACIA5A_27220 [Micromonospora sp. NPDC051300]|uniref:hypothetical protein n=1 Tax=Micromonospora sp. NPDC051300 TaxID=3364286 RepID=UPI0037B03642